MSNGPITRPFGALVVDDEIMLVTMLRRILVAAGFIVVTGRSGNEGIAVLDESAADVDVVLCDMLMPGNGSTLARYVRRRHPEISLVLMSGLEAHEVEPRVRDLSAVGWLPKPFVSAEDVVATLRSAAARTRALRSPESTA